MTKKQILILFFSKDFRFKIIITNRKQNWKGIKKNIIVVSWPKTLRDNFLLLLRKFSDSKIKVRNSIFIKKLKIIFNKNWQIILIKINV